MPSGLGTGSNPFESALLPPLAEGATLAVFYRAPNSPFKLTLVYEAPISGAMFSGAFDTVLGGVQAPTAVAKFTLVGADGQIGGGLVASAVSSETSFFQGKQIAGPPPAPAADNDSDWNGSDTQPLNQLWDTRTHLVSIEPGSTQAAVRYTAPGPSLDCLVTVAFLLSL